MRLMSQMWSRATLALAILAASERPADESADAGPVHVQVHVHMSDSPTVSAHAHVKDGDEKLVTLSGDDASSVHAHVKDGKLVTPSGSGTTHYAKYENMVSLYGGDATDKTGCSLNAQPTQCSAGQTANNDLEGMAKGDEDSKPGTYQCKREACTMEDAQAATKKLYSLGSSPPPDVPAKWEDKNTIMPGVEYPEFKKMEQDSARVMRIDVNVGRNCPCVGHGQSVDGLATWAGMRSEKDHKAFLMAYPADFGYNCKAWDLNRHPSCLVAENVPDWCSKPWCYVDKQSCHDDRIQDYQGSSYFDWNKGGGFIKNMHYSWQRCDESLDHEGPSDYEKTTKCYHVHLERCEQEEFCTLQGNKCVPKSAVAETGRDQA
eukprot:gb/GFBE01010710.1/.p1 GENE.gb/GFBE01010710.1/~~gb/GFBE01010710.1/.p1  ORF type:complete len:375 (+),score=73.91 gb/GFBE01010710.1/:1-1125(+)